MKTFSKRNILAFKIYHEQWYKITHILVKLKKKPFETKLVLLSGDLGQVGTFDVRMVAQVGDYFVHLLTDASQHVAVQLGVNRIHLLQLVNFFSVLIQLLLTFGCLKVNELLWLIFVHTSLEITKLKTEPLTLALIIKKKKVKCLKKKARKSN